MPSWQSEGARLELALLALRERNGNTANVDQFPVVEAILPHERSISTAGG